MGGLFLFVSQYMQLVTGYTPLVAGLWLVPASLGMIGSTNLAPRLAARYGQWPVITAGMAMAAVGVAVLTQAGSNGTPVVVLAGLLVAIIGLGPGAALVTDIVVVSAPPERAGSAASLSETSAEFGIAMGVATLGSLGTAVYRSNLAIPDGTPLGAAAAVNESLPSAVAAAEHVPAALAEQLLNGAGDAFTTGLNVVAALGAIAILIAVVFLVRMIRQYPAQGDTVNTAIAEAPAEPSGEPCAFTT